MTFEPMLPQMLAQLAFSCDCASKIGPLDSQTLYIGYKDPTSRQLRPLKFSQSSRSSGFENQETVKQELKEMGFTQEQIRLCEQAQKLFSVDESISFLEGMSSLN